MSVTAKWDNERQTRLCFIFDNMWQLEDLYDAIVFSHELIEERGEIIDVILDMSKCNSMPSNLAVLRDHLTKLDQDRVGALVFVTQNDYLQEAMQLLNKLMRKHFTMHFTQSLNNARRILIRVAITREHHLHS